MMPAWTASLTSALASSS